MEKEMKQRDKTKTNVNSEIETRRHIQIWTRTPKHDAHYVRHCRRLFCIAECCILTMSTYYIKTGTPDVIAWILFTEMSCLWPRLLLRTVTLNAFTTVFTRTLIYESVWDTSIESVAEKKSASYQIVHYLGALQTVGPCTNIMLILYKKH